ncbi:MAG: DUF5623 domain-containing protein [Pseudoxanthomonas sp.]
MNRENLVMSNLAIHPSTLDGIKRLAKSIKRERTLTHLQSLNEAARQAGFENFRHAQNNLPFAGRARLKESHPLFVTAYWRSRDGKSKGRETLEIRLSSPWEQLVTKAQLQYHRALMRFRGDAPDHLERTDDVDAQERAREAICAAARTMQFMDATKLRPASRAYRAFHKIHPKLPGLDHSSDWIDPVSSRMMVMDEPYDPPVGHKQVERAAWAAQHGFRIEIPNWAGLYVPGHSVVHLISHEDSGIPLNPLISILNALPAPVTATGWSGESAAHSPVFSSPGRQAMPAKKRERRDPSNTLRTYGNSIGYVQTFVGPQRRPDARMPISAHEEIGKILKSVMSICHNRRGIANKIDAVRSELDEWIQREYDQSELPSERFHQIYYGDNDLHEKKSITDTERMLLMENLDEITGILSRHYPDCAPRRALIRSIGTAQKALIRWQ